jgi:hypothetical protein
MKPSLKEIWKNRKQIMEGITNSIIRDEFVEEIAAERLAICNTCEFKDDVGESCALTGSQPCCSICGCAFKFKTRALSSECPEEKWKAVVTEEDEDKLDNLK